MFAAAVVVSIVKKHSFANNYFLQTTTISYEDLHKNNPQQIHTVVLATPTVLVVRSTSSVASDHSPSDEHNQTPFGQTWASHRSCAHVARFVLHKIVPNTSAVSPTVTG